ncbi:Protein THYLAKOID FORMATION 1- chloroplastic [Striga hermonthica]|uniref:Protein THYLAKOID FORMATION 1- chloroplastic n=1 Tax=Striga hermonthica TaxID=68872 RepID=A0A9N7MM86_STRHE|nr:Protein THYLAKOID FORMATION 1- chloroplastic [Striga hermonthica]
MIAPSPSVPGAQESGNNRREKWFSGGGTTTAEKVGTAKFGHEEFEMMRRTREAEKAERVMHLICWGPTKDGRTGFRDGGGIGFAGHGDPAGGFGFREGGDLGFLRHGRDGGLGLRDGVDGRRARGRWRPAAETEADDPHRRKGPLSDDEFWEEMAGEGRRDRRARATGDGHRRVPVGGRDSDFDLWTAPGHNWGVSLAAVTQSADRKISGPSARNFLALNNLRLTHSSCSFRRWSSSSRMVVRCMSTATDPPTVSETKLNFLNAYKRPIPSIYNTVLQELIVQQHLMRYKRSYYYDPVFALGFVTVYDQLMDGYPSNEDREAIFKAYIEALNEDPAQYRADAQKLEEWARTQTGNSLVDFASREGEVEDILKDISKRAGSTGSFSYSRFFAVGLFRLIELANATEPTVLDMLCAALNVNKKSVDRDLDVYRNLLSKLVQAKELLKEYVERLNNKHEVLRGAENWISNIRELKGSKSMTGLGVSGSPKFDVSDVDFGWGKARTLEVVSIDGDHYSMSLSKSRDSNGGLEVGLSLPRNRMEAFGAVFAKGLMGS